MNKARRSIIHTLVLLVHPEKVRVSSIAFNRTFGLGGMALLLFVLQAITGILLRFVYEPTPTGAYDSIIFIREQVYFGGLVRNIHYWSGMLIVVITFLHLLRVFYTQAYYPPRRLNWIIGIVLLLLVIMMNFTGYLLPWDQLSYWAVTVITNMLVYIPFLGEGLANAIRGGEEVSGPTLLIFYNLHTGVLPILLLILLVYHFWKVRRAGGVVVPADGNNGFIPAIPHLLQREIAIGLALLALIMLLAVFVDAPLLERADPSFSPNPVKAPWYFSGVQELLLHFHPTVAVFVIPFLMLAWLFSFPYLKPDIRNQGVWFYSAKGKKIVVTATVASLIITIAAIFLGEYIIDLQSWMPYVPEIISNGFIPLVICVLLIGMITVLVRKYFRAGRSEMHIWIFTFFVVAYIILMLTGIFFRGEGMRLLFIS